MLENGWPVLIIDVEDLIRSIDNLLSGRQIKKLSAEAAVPEEVRGPKRVLVVDDSITVRELERQLLENRGYTVDVAVDGVDGWNAVRSGRYDLVVSDIDMPRMDGIQLVAHIKEDARLKAIPVIIVSYKDREEDRVRGLDVVGQFLPDQEQLPRPDVPGYGGRPDWRGGELMEGHVVKAGNWP